MKARNKRKVLLIGWDAADWKVIHPLLDSGKMPALEKLIDRGVSANIATLEPVLSPMLWSSIATGKLADKHGILGFTEADTKSGNVRPVSGASRKVKAIWNILSHQNYHSNVIGWWPSHPAEPIKGICVSNLYQRANQDINKPWPMLEGTVYPSEMASIFKELRIHPAELTAAHVLPFIPKLDEINQEEDKRLSMFLKILADAATIQAAATYSMENTDWDFTAVYFDAIDHFSHGFMKYHPPKLEPIPEKDFELYKEVVSGGYIFHDMMLERLVQMAGEETTIILLSDHGFQSDHLRPLSLPKEPAAPAYEHRAYGIFCMAGPGIKKDELIYGVSLLDITPTLLHLFDLPVGKDMDGKVLLQAFEGRQEVNEIPSWEEVPGEFGMHKAEDDINMQIDKEALDQLVELGYIDKPDENSEVAMKRSIREANVNLAKVYLSTSRFSKAAELFEKLIEEKKEPRLILNLVQCYKQMGKSKEAFQFINKLKKNKKSSIKGKLALYEAEIYIQLNQGQKALEALSEADKFLSKNVSLLLNTGRAYLLLRKWKKAQLHFEKCLELDPDKAPAYHGLGISLLKQRKYETAAEYLLNAIALNFNFPIAHYHLGLALINLKFYQDAANAFENSLQQNPNIARARTKLINLYESGKALPIKKVLKEVENVEQKWTGPEIALNQLKKEQKDRNLGTVYIVSGLPRSGTSMCMQMLDKGGLTILTDNERISDQNNPKGYYEFEDVKSIRRNAKWISKAKDKVVKVVAPLLPFLPDNYQYKVVFIDRNMKEVLSSQHKMMVSLGKIKEGDYHPKVEFAFQKELIKANKWLNKVNVESIRLNYEEVIKDPAAEIRKINGFFGGILDTLKMQEVVDPNLYRNRSVIKP